METATTILARDTLVCRHPRPGYERSAAKNTGSDVDIINVDGAVIVAAVVVSGDSLAS